MSSADAIDHGGSRTGRWLRERRLRIVLWIAVLEGLVVWLSPGISRWTVVIVAVLAIALYVAAGRSTQSDTGHQLSWILAASQSLAVVVVALSFLIKWLALVFVVVFAAVALVILFTDRDR